MKEQKIIVVGNDNDVDKVIEALDAMELETTAITIDDFRELPQEVFEIRSIVKKVNHACLPTKRERQASKMDKLRKRRRK